MDFERRELTVRDAKSGKDRPTLLPQSRVAALSRGFYGKFSACIRPT